MFNFTILDGRLTADPELKTLPNGTLVTTFCIATQRDYKSENGETEADFIDVIAWRQKAEFITKYFKKGNRIGIAGSIRTQIYTDKNGNKRKDFKIEVEKAYFMESKKNNDVKEAEPTPYNNEPHFEEIADDEFLPF